MSNIRPTWGTIGGNINDQSDLSGRFDNLSADIISNDADINYISGEVSSNDADILFLSGEWKTGDTLAIAYPPSGYSASNPNVSGHFDGISKQLDNIKTNLNSYNFQEDTTDRSTNLTSWSDYTSWTTPNMISGDYFGLIEYNWGYNNVRNKAKFRILVDGTQVGEEVDIESKDVGNRSYETFFGKFALSGGVHNFTLQFASSNSSYTCTIYDASYIIKKLGV